MVKINYATHLPRTFATRISREGGRNENENETETETQAENERKTNSRQLNQFQHGVGPVPRSIQPYPAASWHILAYPDPTNGHARTLAKKGNQRNGRHQPEVQTGHELMMMMMMMMLLIPLPPSR